MEEFGFNDGLAKRIDDLVLTSVNEARAVELGRWLAGAERLGAKIEMTGLGRKAAQVGRAVKHNGSTIYNVAWGLSSLAMLCAKFDFIPKAALPMAQLAQLSSIALFGGAVGAICLGKAGLVAIRDRHSFTDALGKGLGVLGSTKVYAKHLGAEMQAGLPNPHAASHGGLTLLAWSAGKFGMGQASIGLKNKAQGALARLEVFDKWRAGVARKARFMLNREQRSLETYREAVRLFLAESWGHFELRANATKLARHGLPVGLRLDAESSALCCALAAGFEKAFPAKLGRGCLPEREKSKKNVLCVGVAEAVCLVVAGANDSDADPFYAPRADMPSLADLLGLSVAKALRDPEIRAAHAWVLSEISEPWIAALENKSIRAAVMPEMDSSANSASPAKKTNRL